MRGTLSPPPSTRLALRSAVLWPSWVLVSLVGAGFAVASAAGVGPGPVWTQYLPFAVSLVLFGLPHGAVDHLAPARLAGRRAWPRYVLGVILLYLILSGLYVALWYTSPVAAFVLFVALTWFHWGEGDLYSLLAITGAGYLDGGVLRLLTIFVRGGLPMLVPLLAFPEMYRSTAHEVMVLFGSGEVSSLDWVFASPFRIIAGFLFATLAVGGLILGRRRSGSPEDRRAWREDAVETIMLAGFFALVPPLFAIGLYFCLWHSLRFVARLVLLDGYSSHGKASLLSSLASFFRDAAPHTAVALALLAGLYFMVPGADSAAQGLLAVYLVLISVLTLPHVVVVLWMDIKEGLFPIRRSVHRTDEPR